MEGYHGIGGIPLDSPRHCDWIPGSCGMTNFSGAQNGKNWEINLLERLVNRNILLEFHNRNWNFTLFFGGCSTGMFLWSVCSTGISHCFSFGEHFIGMLNDWSVEGSEKESRKRNRERERKKERGVLKSSLVTHFPSIDDLGS